MKTRPEYEIHGGEGFPQVDAKALTIGGQLEDVIERIKLNPAKEMRHEQKGMMMYTNFSFNTQPPDITKSQSKHAVNACHQRQAREKFANSVHGWLGLARDWLNDMFLLM